MRRWLIYRLDAGHVAAYSRGSCKNEKHPKCAANGAALLKNILSNIISHFLEKVKCAAAGVGGYAVWLQLYIYIYIYIYNNNYFGYKKIRS